MKRIGEEFKRQVVRKSIGGLFGLLGILFLIPILAMGQADSVTNAAQATVSVPAKFEEPLTQVDMVDERFGWGIQSGNVVSTSDGGRTWETRAVAQMMQTAVKGMVVRDEFSEIVGLSRSDAVAIRGESVGRTSDGGSSWSQTRMEDIVIRTAAFSDGSNGWLAAEKRTAGGVGWRSVLFATSDGGVSWNEVKLPNATGVVWDVFADTGRLWVVGDVFASSRDRGKTWERSNACPDVYGTPAKIGFSDGAHGWLRTNQGANFCVTSDGGSSWQTRAYPAELGQAHGLLQITVNELWAFGEKGAFVSRDDGHTWKRAVVGRFLSADVIPGGTKLFFAGDIVRFVNLSDRMK